MKLLALLAAVPLLSVQDATLIHSMDDLKLRDPDKGAHTETVEGKFGKAVKFTFEGEKGYFVPTPLRGKPEWDQAAGFSFWVKGDGTKGFGGIEFIWNDDYGARYDYMFPIDSTEWKKVVVAWRDLIPVMPTPASKFLDPKSGNAPSKLTSLWFGKWWYWREYPACSFAIDEMRLEPKIELDQNLYVPAGAPLERVRAKVKAGKPVTIVTIEDSLTDTRHWANRQVNWPGLLTKKLQERKIEARIVNPAIGGTELRQNLVLMPRWLAEAPEPDLVTVCFGGNDWNSGMRGPMFQETVRETIDRIRRATKGKADVLILTTVPCIEMWKTRDELGAAARAAARERNAGLADAEKAFHDTPEDQHEKLFCSDKVHMGAPGHEILASLVVAAIESGGK